MDKMHRIIPLAFVTLLLASCSSDTDEGQDAQPTAASGASVSASTEASIGGATVADLEGTWIGVLIEPARKATYSLRVTFGECSPGQECGRWVAKGETIGTCPATLTYEGIEDAAFMFEEAVESGPCVDGRLAVVPMPGDYAIGVEEYWEGAWGSFGALLNENYHIGYP